MDAEDTLQSCIDNLQSARATLAQLIELKDQQEADRIKIAMDLDQLEVERGKASLDATLAGDGLTIIKRANKIIVDKRDELEIVDNLLASIGPRIEAAQKIVNENLSACFFAEAEALEMIVDERQIKTDRLLIELREFEEIEYSPKPPDRSPGPVRHVNAGGGNSPALGVILTPTPKTEQIRRQANYYRICGDCILTSRPLPTSIIDGKPPFPLPAWYVTSV